MAKVIPIGCHPKYQPQFKGSPILPYGDEADQAMTDMFQQALEEGGAEKEIAAAIAREEQAALGNNVCWQCIYRKDMRPLWKRLLFSANESSYECTSIQRTQVADPVSGQARFIERIRGLLGTQLILVDRPHHQCVELNPDGKCPMFNPGLSKKKKDQKE